MESMDSKLSGEKGKSPAGRAKTPTRGEDRWEDVGDEEGGPTRKKIKITQIDDKRGRQTTFTKRKQGLMKKARELSVLCGCEIGILMTNLQGKLLQFDTGSMDTLVTRYREEGAAERQGLSATGGTPPAQPSSGGPGTSSFVQASSDDSQPTPRASSATPRVASSPRKQARPDSLLPSAAQRASHVAHPHPHSELPSESELASTRAIEASSLPFSADFAKFSAPHFADSQMGADPPPGHAPPHAVGGHGAGSFFAGETLGPGQGPHSDAAASAGMQPMLPTCLLQQQPPHPPGNSFVGFQPTSSGLRQSSWNNLNAAVQAAQGHAGAGGMGGHAPTMVGVKQELQLQAQHALGGTPVSQSLYAPYAPQREGDGPEPLDSRADGGDEGGWGGSLGSGQGRVGGAAPAPSTTAAPPGGPWPSSTRHVSVHVTDFPSVNQWSDPTEMLAAAQADRRGLASGHSGGLYGAPQQPCSGGGGLQAPAQALPMSGWMPLPRSNSGGFAHAHMPVQLVGGGGGLKPVFGDEGIGGMPTSDALGVLPSQHLGDS